MAALGLKEIFKLQGFCAKTILLSDFYSEKVFSEDGDFKEGPHLYVFYVPRALFYFSLTLLSIAQRITKHYPGANYIFVSSVPCDWLYRNILQMTGGENFTFNARIVSSKLSVNRLEQYFKRVHLNLPYTIRECFPVINGYVVNNGLTIRETQALLELFSGIGTNFVEKNKKVATKTLYNQRRSGLRKMIENSDTLARQLPGASKRWRTRLAHTELSPYEKDFLAGIEMCEVYEVYQPIVNSSRCVIGFEILTRWRQKGHDIYPDEFLTGLKSESILLLLTAMGLKRAVEGINQYKGEYSFAVNISPYIGGCSGLIKMCAEACRQLKDIQWKKKLVLEYSEKSDFYSSRDIVSTVNELSKLGVTIFLDDCFSENSISYPVRGISFNGYKLDKTIIDNSLTNKDDMALIASLAGYCSMTERQCIAEGVEDMVTFEKLKRLGIEFFQGYLFSKPVSIAELPCLVLKSKLY